MNGAEFSNSEAPTASMFQMYLMQQIYGLVSRLHRISFFKSSWGLEPEPDFAETT